MKFFKLLLIFSIFVNYNITAMENSNSNSAKEKSAESDVKPDQNSESKIAVFLKRNTIPIIGISAAIIIGTILYKKENNNSNNSGSYYYSDRNSDNKKGSWLSIFLLEPLYRFFAISSNQHHDPHHVNNKYYHSHHVGNKKYHHSRRR